jgi:hypothetical protein
MACNHERIKSVNCVIYCDICGEKLPVDYLVGKGRIAAQAAAEEPEKAHETPKKTTRRKKV